jgi:hypothetical protein
MLAIERTLLLEVLALNLAGPKATAIDIIAAFIK